MIVRARATTSTSWWRCVREWSSATPVIEASFRGPAHHWSWCSVSFQQRRFLCGRKEIEICESSTSFAHKQVTSIRKNFITRFKNEVLCLYILTLLSLSDFTYVKEKSIYSKHACFLCISLVYIAQVYDRKRCRMFSSRVTVVSTAAHSPNRDRIMFVWTSLSIVSGFFVLE